MPQLAVFCLLARVSLFQPSHAIFWFSTGLLLTGNGLKSSSMYLGKDLIVFTKTKTTQSIGLLSQTFLEETGMSEVRVPLVCRWFHMVACLYRSLTCCPHHAILFVICILIMDASAVSMSDAAATNLACFARHVVCVPAQVSWDLQGNPLQASEAHTEQSMEAITRCAYNVHECCFGILCCSVASN
jgi:hypothetical protein